MANLELTNISLMTLVRLRTASCPGLVIPLSSPKCLCISARISLQLSLESLDLRLRSKMQFSFHRDWRLCRGKLLNNPHRLFDNSFETHQRSRVISVSTEWAAADSLER